MWSGCDDTSQLVNDSAETLFDGIFEKLLANFD